MSKIKTLNVRRCVAVFMAVLMMVLSLSYTNNMTDATNTAKTYFVYEAETGNLIRRYTLNPIESYDNKQSRTIGIFGDDDREEDQNCNGVVLVGTGICTGFIIDDHIIATAAHCLYNKKLDKGRKFNKISVLNNFGSVALNATPVEYHIPSSYIKNENTDGYDYALVTVKEDLSSYPHFEIGVALDSVVGADVKISGFPAFVDGSCVNSSSNPVIYTGIGNIIGINDTQILTNVDASEGNSGGPVYIEENMKIGGNEANYKTAVAIHIAGSSLGNNITGPNIGVRFTTNHINFYRANKNIKWE